MIVPSTPILLDRFPPGNLSQGSHSPTRVLVESSFPGLHAVTQPYCDGGVGAEGVEIHPFCERAAQGPQTQQPAAQRLLRPQDLRLWTGAHQVRLPASHPTIPDSCLPQHFYYSRRAGLEAVAKNIIYIVLPPFRCPHSCREGCHIRVPSA